MWAMKIDKNWFEEIIRVLTCGFYQRMNWGVVRRVASMLHMSKNNVNTEKHLF